MIEKAKADAIREALRPALIDGGPPDFSRILGERKSSPLPVSLPKAQQSQLRSETI